MTADYVSCLFVPGGFETHSRGLSLPYRRPARRIALIIEDRILQFFFQQWLTAPEFDHQGIQFLVVIRDSAVRDIIAIPTGNRAIRIELRQIQRRDAPGHAIHQHPPASLPEPPGCSFIGQAVIYPESAPHYEQPLGISCGLPIVNSLSLPST